MRTILNTRRGAAGLAVLTLTAVVPFAACTSSAAGDARVRGVAAENFWGDGAAQVAGPAVAVRSVVSRPDADPHDYEPTPQDARDFARARLVIVNGIGYDPWARQILDADPGHDRI